MDTLPLITIRGSGAQRLKSLPNSNNVTVPGDIVKAAPEKKSSYQESF